MHLLEKRTSLREKGLPFRLLQRIASSLGTGVQAGKCPDVTNLVRLTGVGMPKSHNLPMPFASGKSSQKRVDPLTDRAGFDAVVAKFVDISGRGGCHRPYDPLEQPYLLADDQRANKRRVFRRPALVPGELGL